MKMVFRKIKNKLFPSEEIKNLYQWEKDNGDFTHRLNYSLSENSVVFDLGGYHGQWASDIYSMYLCKIYVFEPYTEFFNTIKSRFRKNPRIKIYNFGLHSKDIEIPLNIANDGSSIHRKSKNKIPVELKDISTFLREQKINEIDLMKINIEGAEYDLLDHMIDQKITSKIKNLQIQFHSFIKNADKKIELIHQQLSKTHFLTYQYGYVWENWQKKE